jgi:hypothetical protein
MTAHKHAALMAEYAKDAAETDKPWERWEVRNQTCPIDEYRVWNTCRSHPEWVEGCEYRRKPKPAECWVFVSDGVVGQAYSTEQQARNYEDQAKGFGWRLAHMREVIE